MQSMLPGAMDFIKCYLCGDLAVQEHVTRDLTVTIFCTSKLCGRYEVEYSALQAFQAGACMSSQVEEITSEVYAANRQGEQILITSDYLVTQSKATP